MSVDCQLSSLSPSTGIGADEGNVLTLLPAGTGPGSSLSVVPSSQCTSFGFCSLGCRLAS